MLVLSRKVQDSIVLPDLGIAIQILQVRGKCVRIGIEAPIEIKVVRGELLQEDDRELLHEIELNIDDLVDSHNEQLV